MTLEQLDTDLQRVIQKQQSVCNWREGNPVRVFLCDGYECVEYESGNWWHYDTKKQTWF